jgi:hypothetical protein
MKSDIDCRLLIYWQLVSDYNEDGIQRLLSPGIYTNRGAQARRILLKDPRIENLHFMDLRIDSAGEYILTKLTWKLFRKIEYARLYKKFNPKIKRNLCHEILR